MTSLKQLVVEGNNDIFFISSLMSLKIPNWNSSKNNWKVKISVADTNSEMSGKDNINYENLNRIIKQGITHLGIAQAPKRNCYQTLLMHQECPTQNRVHQE